MPSPASRPHSKLLQFLERHAIESEKIRAEDARALVRVTSELLVDLDSVAVAVGYVDHAFIVHMD